MTTFRRVAGVVVLGVLLGAPVIAPARASFVDWLGAEDERLELGGTQIVSGDLLRVRSTSVVAGDVYAAVQNASVAGEIDGDLNLFAQDADVTGRVLGDLQVAALQPRMNGRVGDDLRAAGVHLSLDGHVVGDAFLAAASTVRLFPGTEVGGSLAVTAPRVVLKGRISGPVRVSAALVELDAVLEDSAWIECDELKLGPSGRIEGDLVYDARNEIVPPEDYVAGEVTRTYLKERSTDDFFTQVELPELGAWGDVYLAIVSLISGALFLLFLKPLADGALDLCGNGAGLAASFGIGLVSLLAMLVSSFLCIVLLPLSLGLLSALGALLFFGGLIGKMVLGCLLLTPLVRRRCHAFLGLLVGVLAMFLIGLVPVLGHLVWVLVTVTGMGATLLRLRGGGTPVEPPGQPPPPPDNVPAT